MIAEEFAVNNEIRFLTRYQELEERWQALVDTLPDHVILLGVEGKIQIINQAIPGFTIQQLVGTLICDYIPASQQDILRNAMKNATDSGKSVECEVPIISIKNHTTWWLFRIGPVKHSGKITGFLIVGHEITERKQNEEKTKQSLSLLKATLESTADGILVVNKKGRIVSYNDRFAKMWQIPTQLMNSGEDEKVLSHMLRQLENPQQFIDRTKELYFRLDVDSFDLLELLDGRIFERFSIPQRIEGEAIGRVWSYRDITKQKSAEETIRRSQEKYKSLFDNVPVGIYRSTPDGEINDANPALIQILGYPNKKSLLSVKAFDLYVSSKERHRWQTILERNGLLKNYQMQLKKKDGKIIWVSNSAKIVHDADGNIIGYEGIVEEVTDHKRVQEDREKLIFELQAVLSKVKKLSGLVPICASCKKIRDDKGYWNQIEDFIREHSDAEFSHSICPECLRKLYPEFKSIDK